MSVLFMHNFKVLVPDQNQSFIQSDHHLLTYHLTKPAKQCSSVALTRKSSACEEVCAQHGNKASNHNKVIQNIERDISETWRATSTLRMRPRHAACQSSIAQLAATSSPRLCLEANSDLLSPRIALEVPAVCGKHAQTTQASTSV
jgi:hypothetical protein